MANILLIDDDPLVRQSLRQALEHLGHWVAEANEGGAGLRAAERSMPDLVISDLLMPGKEGIETIQSLRAAYPDLRIVAISGGGRFGGGDNLTAARHLGADATLEKPISVAQLRATVDELLARGPRTGADPEAD